MEKEMSTLQREKCIANVSLRIITEDALSYKVSSDSSEFPGSTKVASHRKGNAMRQIGSVTPGKSHARVPNQVRAGVLSQSTGALPGCIRDLSTTHFEPYDDMQASQQGRYRD